MNSSFSESNLGSHGHMDGPKTDDVKTDAPKASNASGMAPAAESPAVPDVFRYGDYRAFLKDRFIGMQALDPAFSQRGLARKAGIANPGFFNEVIKGRRRLSTAAALKMAIGLGLSEEETEFFSTLVDYAETRESREKVTAGKRLIAMRNQKFLTALSGGLATTESLQDIVRELNREGVFQTTNLEGQSSAEDREKDREKEP
ncbi:MAG: TIGR02147 family protein [Fibrobacteria bacterium]